MSVRRVVGPLVGALAMAVGIAAVSGVPARASEPSSIVINETITATDGDAALPSIDLVIVESVSATDGDSVLPAVVLSISESVSVADSETVLPAVVLMVSESVGVADSETVTPSPSVPIDESVGVTDSVTITIVDSTPPTSIVSFPANGGLYNASAWNAGCPTPGFCGSAADNPGGSGVAKVELSLRRGSGGWWGGSAFDSVVESYLTANGSSSWSYAFAIGALSDGTYTLHVRATDNNGNVETPTTVTFTIDTTPPDTIIDTGPASVTYGTTATFTFHATETGSTFRCRIDAVVAACNTSKTYTSLALGAHTFTVEASDTAGNVDPTPASRSWSIYATTSLLYNGPQILMIGSTIKPAALLSSAAPACRSAQPVSFALDRNPTSGATGTYALPGSATNSSGQATSVSVSTSGWLEGVYTISASYAGSSSCDAAADSATLTLASAGDAASGGGWYTLSGSGRVNFGFTVKKQTDGTYKGQFVLINNGKWRLKGTLTSFVKTGSQGAAGGSGDLFYWVQSANGGLGGWVLSQANTTFTASFADKGTGTKSTSDTFGVHIDHASSSPPEPTSLPNSSPVAIKGGDVRVS
jgi:Big-like domain-containing protein